MKSLSSSILLLVTLVIIIVTWVWLDKNQPEIKAELREIAPTRVQTVNVIQQPIQPYSLITGRLVPALRTALHFEISGQLDEKLVEAGQSVKQGDPLLRIRAGDFKDIVLERQTQLEQEQSVVQRDRKLLALITRQAGLLRQEVGRLETLQKKSLIAQSKLDEIRRQELQQRSQQEQLRFSVETAAGRLKLREVELSKAQRNLDRTLLKAPVPARVNAVLVNEGDYVSPGQAVIELVQIDQLDLLAEVVGKDLVDLSLGQELAVLINGSEIKGHLHAFQSDPDPKTYTHSLRIRLAGNGLLPGQLGEVRLQRKVLNNALVVPTLAVLVEDGKAFVYQILTQDNQHTVQRVPVQVITRYQDSFVISGIKVGMPIVARDIAALEDGQTVIID